MTQDPDHLVLPGMDTADLLFFSDKVNESIGSLRQCMDAGDPVPVEELAGMLLGNACGHSPEVVASGLAIMLATTLQTLAGHRCSLTRV